MGKIKEVAIREPKAMFDCWFLSRFNLDPIEDTVIQFAW